MTGGPTIARQAFLTRNILWTLVRPAVYRMRRPIIARSVRFFIYCMVLFLLFGHLNPCQYPQ